jgi:prepilin-type N-terminal cleavage/methylation domain-containing protein
MAALHLLFAPSLAYRLQSRREVNYMTIKRNQKNGFTLVELMISIAILAVMVALSIPAFGRFMQTWRLNGETDQLAGMLRSARSAAVSKHVDTVFVIDTSNGTYYYFEDADGDGSRDSNEYCSETIDLPPGITLQGHTLSQPRIFFGPMGNANESGTITLQNLQNRTHTILLFGGTGNISID